MKTLDDLRINDYEAGVLLNSDDYSFRRGCTKFIVQDRNSVSFLNSVKALVKDFDEQKDFIRATNVSSNIPVEVYSDIYNLDDICETFTEVYYVFLLYLQGREKFTIYGKTFFFTSPPPEVKERYTATELYNKAHKYADGVQYSSCDYINFVGKHIWVRKDGKD